ncbi:hypothetical protein AMS68_000562 [Peltaster fructicola]|uniref:Amidohydrolase-related domain-containing protein n=1 Tax=Peltaster fructicola TaxID=286661 RepID=A0A6H0XK97_9PEZI|nr:hypothetical protein AMS68_000562 [Peltaster fructicola]
MATKALINGTIVSFDDKTLTINVRRNASILISNGIIQEIVDDLSADRIPQGTEVIDVQGKIVSPGFVNTHVHMWQAALRTMGPNVTLPHYFDCFSMTSKVASAFSAEDVYLSSLEGYYEGRKLVMKLRYILERGSGGATTCVIVQVIRESQQWEALKEIAEQRTAKDDLVKLGLAYDQLASGLPDKLDHTVSTIKEHKLAAITVHHLGGVWPGGPNAHTAPNSLCKHGLHTAGVPIVVSHAGYLTTEDMSAMRAHNVHVSITPESEFHYGHCQVTGTQILDKASLGIDTPFTFSGDILTQARLWLQHARHMKYQECLETGKLPKQTPMTVEQGFLLATRQGGLAMHRRDVGVLQVGAKADLVVFNGDSPNMLGWSDPVAAIMLHANVGDIEHVLIDGEWRKRDFELVDKQVPWSELKKKFVKVSRRVQTHAAHPPPIPEKLWGVGEMGDVEVLSTIKK